MGYNGFLAGTDHKSIVRNGHEQATIHAEINAITDAAKRAFFPVDIWLNVFASVLGFSLTPIFTLLFFDFAIRFISFISLKDSALISKIFLSIAKLISLVVLPTLLQNFFLKVTLKKQEII
jgi:hypothetical protein